MTKKHVHYLVFKARTAGGYLYKCSSKRCKYEYTFTPQIGKYINLAVAVLDLIIPAVLEREKKA